MDTSIIKAIARIANTDDGQVLINCLKEMSEKNYGYLKKSHVDMHSLYVGRAQAIDEIIDFLINAEKESRKTQQPDVSDWSV